jgi:hypothetical protein
MMNRYVYYDVLDTAYTAPGVTREENRQANERIQLGKAELMMSVLRGWRPVFPQTHGWDSSALLSYTGEPGVRGGAFKWLVEHGFIQIRLRDAESILDAASKAFEQPAYGELSAWPGFNTPDARRPLVEAIRTGRDPKALPEEACRRLDLLRDLSAAAAQAPPVDSESPRGNKLCNLITKVADVASDVDTSIGDLLKRCTQIDGANNRTAIDSLLKIEEQCGTPKIPQVRDITNACFNLVAADCVGAKCIGLTTPPSQDVSPIEILGKALPDSKRADVFEIRGDDLNSKDIAELNLADWDTIQSFVSTTGTLLLSERDREAEAAKIIAKVLVDRDWHYTMRTRFVNFLALGSLGMAGFMFGGPGLSLILVGLASGLSGIDYRSMEKDQLSVGVEKKWYGLLSGQ